MPLTKVAPLYHRSPVNRHARQSHQANLGNYCNKLAGSVGFILYYRDATLPIPVPPMLRSTLEPNASRVYVDKWLSE